MATAQKAKKQKAVSLDNELPMRHWFHAQYMRHVVTNKRRRIALSIGVFFAIIIAFQLAYPVDRALPFAQIAGQSVQLATHESMAKIITEKFNTTRVKLSVATKTVEFELKSAGAEPNTEIMIEQLSGYPLWLRLVPGSIFWKPSQVSTANVYFANKPFKEFISSKTKELNFPPQNARLSIKDGKLVAEEAIEGSEVNSATVLRAVSEAEIRLGETSEVDIPAKRIKATRYSKDLASVRHEAEAALAHTLTIKADTKEFSPSKKEIASWLVLDDVNKKVVLRVDKEKVKAYLSDLNKQVGTPAGQTNIMIVDGREMSRSTGASGTALAVDEMAEQIATAVLVPPSTVTINAQFKELLPSVIFNSKYTTTQAGLQAYVNDLASTKNVRIDIQQLDGERWHAAARENESTPSGSTYKLYVALVLFDKMEKGEIH